MKKILSLILLPLAALTCFVGCDKERSLDDIKNYYEIMKNKHIIEVESPGGEGSTKISYLFKKGTGDTFEDAITILYDNELGDRLNPDSTGEIISQTIPTLSDLKTNSWCYDEELYYRYYALKYIQQPILNEIFNYYTKWSNNFYTGMALVGSKDLDQDDLNSVYNKLVELDEELIKFSNARQKFQDDVDVLGFGDVNRSVLTTYTLSVNRLIEKAYNFVNEFKRVHVKYIWNDYNYNSKEGIGTIDKLNRLVDEANLNLSYVVYANVIKPFNDGECDLSQLVYSGELESRTQEIELTSLPYGNLLNSWVNKTETKYTKLSYIKQTVITEADELNEKNTLDKFVYALESYNQKIEVFNKIKDNIDMAKYVKIELGIDKSVDLNDYINSLNEVEKANVNLMNQFFNDTCENYIKQLEKITTSGSNIFELIEEHAAK